MPADPLSCSDTVAAWSHELASEADHRFLRLAFSNVHVGVICDKRTICVMPFFLHVAFRRFFVVCMHACMYVFMYFCMHV